jgi:hypothetical protein
MTVLSDFESLSGGEEKVQQVLSRRLSNNARMQGA